MSDIQLMMAENMTSEQRKENYLCDITYVTNSELGFDYLRDNLATESNSFSLSLFMQILIVFNHTGLSEMVYFDLTEC